MWQNIGFAFVVLLFFVAHSQRIAGMAQRVPKFKTPTAFMPRRGKAVSVQVVVRAGGLDVYAVARSGDVARTFENQDRRGHGHQDQVQNHSHNVQTGQMVPGNDALDR